MEEEKIYTAELKLDIEQVNKYTKKVEQLIEHLKKARELLNEISAFRLEP